MTYSLRKRQRYYQLPQVEYAQYKTVLLIVVYWISDDYMPVVMICSRDDDSPSVD